MARQSRLVPLSPFPSRQGGQIQPLPKRLWKWIYGYETGSWLCKELKVQTKNVWHTCWWPSIHLWGWLICIGKHFKARVYAQEEISEYCIPFHSWGMCSRWMENKLHSYIPELSWLDDKATFRGEKMELYQDTIASHLKKNCIALVTM